MPRALYNKKQTTKCDASELEPDSLAEVPYSMFVQEHTFRETDLYLSSPLGDPSQYDPLCHFLRSANTGDKINLYINTPGGDMASGLAIISAMNDCEATITTILNPEAYSMGALLFLAGHQHVVPENSLLMFHDYSSEHGGKGNEQISAVSATRAWFDRMMLNVCHPFLSKAEIKSISEGRDLWLQADDIRARFTTKNQIVDALPKPAKVPGKAGAKKQADGASTAQGKQPPVAPKKAQSS